ncbi:MAG TPA: sulfite exporter TauE/SafE family protein, partial [Polyangiaceae bacterium]|nr:sulfite exporter TauE/SafE family protein [Polyangiaceae bacterium]
MHAWSIPEAALLVAVGCAAGFVNTAAGAGSLLSLRALMLLGFPAEIANATNRVPVLVQSTVAARGFDKAGLIDRGNVVKTAIPASLGAIVGAVTASHLPEKVMRWVLIVVLL